MVSITALAALLPLFTLSVKGAAIPEKRNDFAPKKWAHCWSFMQPITASGQSIKISAIVPEPANEQAWTEQQLAIYRRNSTLMAQVFTEPSYNLTETYNMFFEYCQPKSGAPKGVLQTVHGVVGNAAYWDPKIDGDDHIYSFPDAAAEAGWATLMYDRLGVGRSDHPDGLDIVSTPYEIEQVAAIGNLLRSGGINSVPQFDTVAIVGHSYGSLLTLGTATKYPDLYDAMVLTGGGGDLESQHQDSVHGSGGNAGAIANTLGQDRWNNLDNTYISLPTVDESQFHFFHYPNYTQAALDAFHNTRGEYSIGQMLTTGYAVQLPRKNFKKPTFVISGEFDGPACAGDCKVTALEGFSNQVEAGKRYFPAVADEDYEWSIVPETGHGINFHTTAYDAYKQIFAFVDQRTQ